MEIVNQHTKRIMEGCKERALDAGLRFDKESLEYIVTNADMLELSPKNMIPTLYDYWLQDIQVLRGKGEYEVFPSNPYETVINTRPAISFYNDNNPDWLNVMIFYHVLAHIDFFQNNKFFSSTWDYDFKEKALAEKRMIARLRSKKGRMVDYVIEFARQIDNLVGYFDVLSESEDNSLFALPGKIDFYFNTFLPQIKKMGMRDFLAEVERYNNYQQSKKENNDDEFFLPVVKKNPEFDDLFHTSLTKKGKQTKTDLMQFIIEESKFLNTPENKWMKGVVEIIRETSLYFSPQIRTKTMNEGWASYWHEKLFMQDDRIKGNEVPFAKINAKVTSLSKVGLNPYAIGWRLYMHIEEMADQGRYSFEYMNLFDIEARKAFDKSTNKGLDFIFHIRENYCDMTFLTKFIEQDFVDKYKLMVVGQRINPEKMVKEYYVKSRKAKDYKKMMIDSLYHPPYIKFDTLEDGTLYLNHVFEEKELYREYIPNTLIGIEYLWGERVQLETNEVDWERMKRQYDRLPKTDEKPKLEPIYRRVVYSVKNKKVTKKEVT